MQLTMSKSQSGKQHFVCEQLIPHHVPGPFLLGYEALPLMDAKKRGGGMQNKEMGRHNARRNDPDDSAFGLGC